MIALFIIAFVLLAATAYTFYRRQHASSDYRAELQPRPVVSPRSLFDQPETHTQHARLHAATQADKEREERHTACLQRATAGDLTTLAEAQRARLCAVTGAFCNIS